MNHLIHVNSSLRVPYLCGDLPACERKAFDDYLATSGFNISSIRNGELDGRSEEEVAAFLQAWLFFGRMDVVFGLWGLSINDRDFIYEDEGSTPAQELVTTESTLLTYLMYLAARVSNSKHADDESIMERVWAEHLGVSSSVNVITNDIIRWRSKTICAHQGHELSISSLDAVILSIILLLEYVDDACMTIFDGERPVRLHWELDNGSRHLLLKAGWCHGEVVPPINLSILRLH